MNRSPVRFRHHPLRLVHLDPVADTDRPFRHQHQPVEQIPQRLLQRQPEHQRPHAQRRHNLPHILPPHRRKQRPQTDQHDQPARHADKNLRHSRLPGALPRLAEYQRLQQRQRRVNHEQPVQRLQQPHRRRRRPHADNVHQQHERAERRQHEVPHQRHRRRQRAPFPLQPQMPLGQRNRQKRKQNRNHDRRVQKPRIQMLQDPEHNGRQHQRGFHRLHPAAASAFPGNVSPSSGHPGSLPISSGATAAPKEYRFPTDA